jgi:hypothetical protein
LLNQDYYTSGRMMFKLAEALGRLALAGREMTRLAGFTARVDMLMSVLNDLEQGWPFQYVFGISKFQLIIPGKYQRTMVSEAGASVAGLSAQNDSLVNGDANKMNGDLPANAQQLLSEGFLQPGGGQIRIKDNLIRFERVPLVRKRKSLNSYH